MIISYEVPNGYSFSKWFAVQEAETGEIIADPMRYADDRIGLIRRCLYTVDSEPEKGIYCFYFGPDGDVATETIRRPIKIVVGDWVTDPKDRAFAEYLLETYRDWRPDTWDDERINAVRASIYRAIGDHTIPMGELDEFIEFIDRFRAMQGELSARADKPERPKDDEPAEIAAAAPPSSNWIPPLSIWISLVAAISVTAGAVSGVAWPVYVGVFLVFLSPGVTTTEKVVHKHVRAQP